ncbi:MAG: hypothetical protein AAC990_07565 [Dehalococcoides mccartyi]|uniref:Uncharacterized protein n=2 Tax=Dehalococcoides mccartyi TaxID=61435 RepID=A0A0V8M4T5_9CHLR|nr:hypothetical protein [Dehalococcoides mccartyi]AAW40326.1 conserved domain protein [Dehalococcoides mccartyi 195]AII59096.1 hypothetical protein X793_01720 [Dehalococcoides mccartyi CG4]KSV18776.1 hypothetical protein DA01_02015 [Dehalococcoides mccartyi]MCF7635420.1 hypothetical protein [Dehalococcoides mccartyi]MEA2121311.1 hypothetical protein [Dehalococcoides mccartyi]
MQIKKDLALTNKLLSQGLVSSRDPETGFRYILCATCPKDGGDGTVARIDRKDNEVERVLFCCSICGQEFAAKPEDIFLT